MTRIGIVGVGGIGRTHLAAYRAAGTPAVAVTDLNRSRSAAAAAEFGTTAYDDLDAMLAAGVDAVSVCTPPAQHHAAALQALRAGVAVLCEKPMAVSTAECDELLTAAGQYDAYLTIGFCHRFQPHIAALKAAIGRGDIGVPLTFRNRFAGVFAGIESTWFSRRAVAGGGALMDTSVHSVDLFRHLIGDVADVRALTATTATPLGPALEVEDTAALLVRSDSGVVGTIEASWRTAPAEGLVTVQGTEGTMTVDYATPMSVTHYSPDGTARDVPVVDGDRFALQARHFLDCLAGTAEPVVTAADGRAAIAVLEAAYASAG